MESRATFVPRVHMVDSSRRQGSGDGHILISGTGRAGTTLLVKYFTALGFDTGFTKEHAQSINTGLEHVSDKEPLPYVIKSPHYADLLGVCLEQRTLDIKCCIVPVRRLFDAAESRRQAGLVWLTKEPQHQEGVLTSQLYKLIEALVRHDVPTYFLHFPTFAASAERLYLGLKRVLDEHGVSREESDAAHREVVDLQLIHRFSSD